MGWKVRNGLALRQIEVLTTESEKWVKRKDDPPSLSTLDSLLISHPYPINNLEIRNWKLEIGNWNLEFVWNLEFRIWDFSRYALHFNWFLSYTNSHGDTDFICYHFISLGLCS